MKNRSALLLVASLCALGAWHLLLRGQGQSIPLITDEGEYAVAARVWSSGGLPYRDAFSQKPPMVFLFYRLASSLSSSPAAPRALAAGMGLLTMLILFFCTPFKWSLRSRLGAPAAFAALAALPLGDYGFTANTETFLNAFTALSALALLRGAPFLAGLAAGAALTTKQTALWTVLGFGLWAALSKGAFSTRAATRYLLAAALFPLAWLIYFAAHQSLGPYWSSAWAGNGRYISVILRSGALASHLRWFNVQVLFPLILLSLPSLVLAGWSLRGLRAGRAHPVETVAVIWFGASLAGALTGLFLFPHYFLQLAPSLALGAACGVERLGASRPRLAWAAVASLALWPALISPAKIFTANARWRALALLYPNPLFETQVLGRELARQASPGDRLHVFGSEGALFIYSGLAAATPHTLCYALTLFPESAQAWREEMARLQAAPPRFIVFSTQPLSTMIASSHGLDYRAAMLAFLGANYLYDGRVRVSPSAQMPSYEKAARGLRPAFDEDDNLLLFTRRF